MRTSLAGYSYHKYYKHLILKKMSNAFAPGDPVLDLAAMTREPPEVEGNNVADKYLQHWIPRKEQDKIDAILSGERKGHYYLLIGEKSTGKSSMLLEAMRKVNGEGISMFEAHADLEIFRIRLGKALDYEFHEEFVYHLNPWGGALTNAILEAISEAFSV